MRKAAGACAESVSMYASFFGFRELPFNNTPDPRFFYSTPDHEEALASLIYAVKERKGFVLLTGEIGAGKTLVTRMMLRHFGTQIAFATIHHAVQSPGDLMESICTEFELPIDPNAGSTHVVRALHDFLLTQFSRNTPVVLVLDEAQNLSVEGFEQLRMIGNLEADDAKLLQIAIVGQPELQRMFQSSSLRQLQQRIFRTFHIPALSRKAVEGYISHRLSVVTDEPDSVFEGGAIDAIYNHSHGLPRLINTICDNALLSAYSAERRTIDAPFLNTVVGQMLNISGSCRGGRNELNAVSQPQSPPPKAHTDLAGSGYAACPDSLSRDVPPAASPEPSTERLASTIERMASRVEEVEERLHRQAAAAAALDPDSQESPDGSAGSARRRMVQHQLSMGRKVEDVGRRVAVVERRLAKGSVGDLVQAQALRVGLEESVRQVRSVLDKVESATQESYRQEKGLRELHDNVKTMAAELRKVLDQARRAASSSTHAERRARVLHARLFNQAERSCSLADDLSRLTNDTVWSGSQSPPQASVMRERFISAVESWRRPSTGAPTPPIGTERIRRVMARTQDSLTGLRDLARNTAESRTNPGTEKTGAEPEDQPAARLAQQVEDLLELMEPEVAGTPTEPVSAPVEQTAKCDIEV